MACNTFIRRSHCTLKRSFGYNLANEKCGLRSILDKVPRSSIYKNVTQSHYSTVIFVNEKNRKSCYLKSPSNKVISALFLSTQDNKDVFQVIVTNPSKVSTEFTSDLSSIAEATKAFSESEISSVSAVNAPDIAVTISNNLQTITEVVEPSLASLGLANNTPVGLVQVILDYLHGSMHMPWWLAIAACTLTARILLLPLLIKTQRNAVNMGNHMPQLQFLQGKFGEARRAGNTLEASRYATEIMQFMKVHDISPIKNALLPMAQAPVFLSFFLALRGMAKAPVESMKEGGLWWATDLTIPDPYYIMPVVACSTLYVVLKIGAESGMKLENMKLAKYVLQALPVVALPFCINFPAAVLYYWVTTNFCTLIIVSVLKIPPVRQYLKLPTQQKIDPKYVMPKKGFVAGVKEAFEDQKALATVEERRRMDDIRFQKAGTGPIPRTYSYDPTKVNPSNVAATARQIHQAISSKEHKT